MRLGEVEQDRPGFEDGNRRAVRTVVVDERGHLVVGTDAQELRRELLAGPDVDRNHVVLDPELLEHDVNLVAVGSRPCVEVEHRVHASVLSICFAMRSEPGPRLRDAAPTTRVPVPQTVSALQRREVWTRDEPRRPKLRSAGTTAPRPAYPADPRLRPLRMRARGRGARKGFEDRRRESTHSAVRERGARIRQWRTGVHVANGVRHRRHVHRLRPCGVGHAAAVSQGREQPRRSRPCGGRGVRAVARRGGRRGGGA